MTGPRLEHLVINASAGSGKTFQLTTRYLALLAGGVPPSHIWAATFTRKAAGEILERVIERLAEAATSEDSAIKLAKRVGRPELARADFARHLRGLLADLHRLRIGTLDSLFLVIAGVFVLECGLPPGWTICDEADEEGYRESALDAAMSDDPDRPEWLARLYERLRHGEARRGVRSDLMRRVEELFHAFRTVPRAGWQCEPPPATADPLDRLLEEMKAIDLGTDRRMIGARDGDCARAGEMQWEDFVCKGLAAKLFAGETTYYKKPISPELVACYKRLKTIASHVVRCEHAEELSAIWEFLESFHDRLAEVRRVGGGLRFDDVTWSLGEQLRPGEAGFDCRIETRIGHLLLDEFQDTSTSQWRALRALARASMAAGGTFFAVGDVKQAIYGWRGGQAELLQRLPAEMGGLPKQAMDQSRRSAQAVIDTVNVVFSNVADLVEAVVWPDGQKPWGGDFRKHETVRGERPGHVLIETGPGQRDDEPLIDLRARHYSWVGERIARLVEAKPGATIGVLCRKNATVGRILYELRQRNVAASEEGGNPITDSPAVEVLLSLLTLADHPGDAIAAFHLIHSPLIDELRKLGYDPSDPAEFSSRMRAALVADGYASVVSGWADKLAALCPRSDRIRLGQLVEIADAYRSRATLRPTDFVTWVRTQRVAAPTSSRVRVLTLHKAKGLEFDAVVLPELDVKLKGISNAYVVADPDPMRLPHGYVGRRVKTALHPLLDAQMREQIATADRQEIEESLSLLYVALTRPREALYIYPPGPQKRGRKDCWDTILLKCHCDLAAADVKTRPAERIVFEAGDANWRPDSPPAAEAPAARVRPAIRFRTSTPSGRRPEWVAPSAVTAGRAVTMAQLFSDSDPTRRQTGLLHHAWYAAVEWLEEREPTDEELRVIAAPLPYAPEDLVDRIAGFRAALRRPAIRRVLSRATYGEAARLERERPFAVRDGDRLVNGRIDRLVWWRSADGTPSAEVIDFKTDEIPDEAVSARVLEYRPQMGAYVRAVAALVGAASIRVNATLVFTTLGRVERLSFSDP